MSYFERHKGSQQTKAGPASSAGSMDNKETKYSYTCNLCNQTFLDNERWKAHKTSHGNKTMKCKFCQELFEDKTTLAHHLQDTHSINQGKLIDNSIPALEANILTLALE